MVYSIVNKSFTVIAKDFFDSPALIILVFVSILFTFEVMGIKVRWWDDMSHWSIAPKAILKYNGIKNIPAGTMSSAQTYTLPLFNSFLTYFTGSDRT